MPQTVPATASLGPIYATTPTVGYRVLALDGSVATAYTTANVVSLGGGFYQVTGGISAPDAGGIIQWWSNNPASGGMLLAIAMAEPAPGETVASAVWNYASGDRSLSGTQANSLIASEALIKALVLGGFEIDYENSTATQRNTDGTVRQVFNLQDKDGNPATSAQTAVKRVPR